MGRIVYLPTVNFNSTKASKSLPEVSTYSDKLSKHEETGQEVEHLSPHFCELLISKDKFSKDNTSTNFLATYFSSSPSLSFVAPCLFRRGKLHSRCLHDKGLNLSQNIARISNHNISMWQCFWISSEHEKAATSF